MRKNLLLISSVILILATPTVAFAEDTMVTTNATTDIVAPTETTTKPTARPLTTSRMEAKDAMKEKMTDAKTEFKDKMTQAREAFKEKLATIKDQKKQERVTNIDSRINEMNQKRTTEMAKHLERFGMVLSKISSRAATLKASGKVTTALDADIASAQTAIDAAKAAILAQAAKDYVVNVTTEIALKGAASTAIKGFFSDIKAVYEKVVAAQKAVQKAHQSLTLISNASATPTVTATP